MKLHEFISIIEASVPLALQEGWDNSGLQVGSLDQEVTRALLCVDVTEEVVAEAVDRGCDVVVSHHPLLFTGLKQVTDQNATGRCVMAAVRHNVAIYSAHTNLDKWAKGVNARLAKMMGLEGCEFLTSKGIDADGNAFGLGMVGNLPTEVDEITFLKNLQGQLDVNYVRYTELTGRSVRKVALCGGSGASLLEDAVAADADVYVTGDVKHHEFLAAEGRIVIADVGHYESEKQAKEILFELISEKMPTFACYLSERDKTPVRIMNYEL